jgi:hypothetical protein
VRSCAEAVKFFSVVQAVYNFFTASTRRWEILMSFMDKGCSTIKTLSGTRWSERQEACFALNQSYTEIVEAWKAIEKDHTKKAVSRCEATGIKGQLERFETVFMAVFWNVILHRLNLTSTKLQSVDVDVRIVTVPISY